MKMETLMFFIQILEKDGLVKNLIKKEFLKDQTI